MRDVLDIRVQVFLFVLVNLLDLFEEEGSSEIWVKIGGTLKAGEGLGVFWGLV